MPDRRALYSTFAAIVLVVLVLRCSLDLLGQQRPPATMLPLPVLIPTVTLVPAPTVLAVDAGSPVPHHKTPAPLSPELPVRTMLPTSTVTPTAEPTATPEPTSTRVPATMTQKGEIWAS